MSLWIKNTSGKPDAVLTLTFIGFVIVVVKLLFAGTTFIVNGDTYNIGDIGASEIGAILTPTLGAYVARRYTDKKFDSEVEDEEEYDEEEGD